MRCLWFDRVMVMVMVHGLWMSSGFMPIGMVWHGFCRMDDGYLWFWISVDI